MPVLNGVTRNSAGSPLAGVSVKVFRSDNDALVASGTSGVDGSYSIVTPATGPYYAVAYKAGSPDIAGTTVNTLTAEAMYSAAVAISAGMSSIAGAGARVAGGVGGAAGSAAVSATGFAKTIPATNGLVIEGDSLMVGASTTNGPISALYASFTGQSGINRATAGDTLANMDSTYSTDVAPYYNATTANTLLLFGGTNDIAGTATLSNLQTSIQSIAAKARATGFVAGVATIPIRALSTWDSGKEAIRQSYNTWLRANYASFADKLVDIAGISQLSDPSNMTYFNGDGLHWTNVTNSIVADYIRTAFGVAALSDTVPDAFTFTDITGATTSTVYTSNTITVSGINSAAALSVTGGTYSKNGGAYTSSSGTVNNGDTVSVQGTSSGTGATAVNVTLTIGGVSDTYTVTTAGTVAPGAAGSAQSITWNPSDKGSAGVLANSNRDFVGPTTGGFATVRTTLSAASGKKYVEFKIMAVSGGSSAFLGIGFATALADVNTYLGNSSPSAMVWLANQSTFKQGENASNALSDAGYIAVLNDVWGLAIDSTAGKVWLSKNNVWFSGDPAAGTTPWITYTPAGAGAIFPAATEKDGSPSATLTIPATTTYDAPSGFSLY